MPLISPVYQDVTTINYTLEWPHLENPSNTTFAGPSQIDICRCRCSSTNTDLGHIYTRYSCPVPKVSFASPEDELWVLQAPLGQINLLRPATDDELERRKEVGKGAKPSAYAGKNFLLLSGPCPRGRYQAFATLQFLRSLSPEARQHVEYLSLLIQPYEEDCCNDQGGRAYIALARYIIEELPAFKSLYLNIWGEPTRIGSRDFAMILWREGVTIVINWDWWGESAEEYTDVDTFLEGIETGVVVKRPIWTDTRGNAEDEHSKEQPGNDKTENMESTITYPCRPGTVVKSDAKETNHTLWEEVSQYSESTDETVGETIEEQHVEQEQEIYASDSRDGIKLVAEDATSPSCGQASSDDEWSDMAWTPRSPAGAGNEDNGWQVL
jgi:hypothetical protein